MQEEITLEKCPLTGLKIENSVAWFGGPFKPEVSYRLHFDQDVTFITLCKSLYDYLTTGKGVGYDDFIQKTSLFFGEISKDNYKGLFKNIIHYNCPLPQKANERHISILEIANKVEQTGNYPKTRKDKLHLILKWLKSNQKVEGASYMISDSFKGWTQCFMSNEEMLALRD